MRVVLVAFVLALAFAVAALAYAVLDDEAPVKEPPCTVKPPEACA